MLPGALEDIDDNLLISVCTEHWPESQTLEFKRESPGSDERARREFAKDVCAFANATGGDLIFGIREKDSAADAVEPILTPTSDELRRRITQLTEGIEPRVAGLRMHSVPFAAGGFALIIRIPASFDGPHCYWPNKEWSRFVVRNGTQTSDMDYGQIRAAFDRSATLAERAYDFRAERVSAIVGGRAWQPMRKGPLAVVHLVPLSSMARGRLVPLDGLYDGGFSRFGLKAAGVTTRTFNLDGLVVHPGQISSEPTLAYTQIFRTGSLESVSYMGHAQMGNEIIPSTRLAEFVRERAATFLSGAASLGVTGPALIGVSLLHVEGVRLGLGNRYDKPEGQADRALLFVPEILIDRIETVDEPDAVARPLLDTLWQCFDERRCLEFDDKGKWIAG